MRTTLTLDDDVAAALEELRRSRNLGLKEAVNEAMRRGLRAMIEPEPTQGQFKTATALLGFPLIPIDNVVEALASAEGEDFR